MGWCKVVIVLLTNELLFLFGEGQQRSITTGSPANCSAATTKTGGNYQSIFKSKETELNFDGGDS